MEDQQGSRGDEVHLPGREVGSRIGSYTVMAELGRGAMGAVFEAVHQDGQRVALKLLTSRRGTSARRFRREAEALASLDHPNLVRFVDAGDGPPPWIAMELVVGVDLAAVLQRGPMDPADAARVVAEVADAVAYAHEHSVIHRDLKPANILIRAEGGGAVVTDFGLTRQLDGSRFTKTGTLVGTLSYMAPEQVHGEREIGAPADVWALGTVLYHCLYGEPPFEDITAVAVAAAIANGRVRLPRRGVARDLEQTCLACLQRDPALRPSAAAVAAALRARRGLGRSARPAIAAVVIAGLLGAALLAISIGWRWGSAASTPSAHPQGDPTMTWPSGPTFAASPAGWRQVWSLDSGPPPEPSAPALWRDEGGRVAAPLAAIRRRREGALAAAFRGEAEWGEGGLVRVRYDAQGVSYRLTPAAKLYFNYAFPIGGITPSDEGFSVLAPNDSSGVQLRIGDAHWLNPKVSMALRYVRKVDHETFDLRLGGKQGGKGLRWSGREGVLQIGPRRVPMARPAELTRLEFQPGGARGERIRVGGESVADLDGQVRDSLSSGPVLISLSETHVEIRDLWVRGRPTRAGRPALARGGGILPASMRVSAVFEQEGDGDGGPLVGLADARGLVLWAEVARDELVLRWRGGWLGTARLKGVPKAGTLVLERGVDAISARCGEARLEVAIPLPLRSGPARACYGSTGPTLRFSAVQVLSGPADPVREAFDQATTGAAADAALDDSPASRWRRAALELARTNTAGFVDRNLRGPERHAAREEVARGAALALESAAEQLEGPLRRDALARAVLARVVAAQSDEARQAAETCVQAYGLEEARGAIDRLEGHNDAPVLLQWLTFGYSDVGYVGVRAASLEAARVLVPEREGEVLARLGDCLRNRRLDPRTPAGRENLERALELFAESKLKGGGSDRVLAYEADALTDLGRYEEAAGRWDECVVARPTDWYAYSRRAQCLAALGRFDEALLSSLEALVAAPGRRTAWNLTVSLAQRVVPVRPGLGAAAAHAVSRLAGDPELEAWVRSLNDASAIGRPPVEQDLMAYLRAARGLDVVPPPGDRSTAVLARARAGDQAARAALRGTAESDRLVRCLAVLDPDLEGLLR